MAWHYTAYAREQEPDDRLAYAAAEIAARASKRGLWNVPGPVPHGTSGASTQQVPRPDSDLPLQFQP